MSAAYLPTTATWKASLTSLASVSSAVTVMVAVPSATPVSVRLDPSEATDTVAMASSEDAAVMVRASPPASVNTPDRDTCRVASIARSVTSAMAADTVGARLGAPFSSSASALATSTQAVIPLSAKPWASAAVMGVSVWSATVSPKARSARSQRSVWLLYSFHSGWLRHRYISAMSWA